MQHLLPRARTETCSCRGQAHDDWRQDSGSVGRCREEYGTAAGDSTLLVHHGLVLQALLAAGLGQRPWALGSV